MHPADPHHTLQACAFGPVISEGYSLGNARGSLLLNPKEKGRGYDAATWCLSSSGSREQEGLLSTELPQEHQDCYVDCGALPGSLHQLELVRIRR